MNARRTVAPAGLRTVSVPPAAPSLATAAIDREIRPRTLTSSRSPPPGAAARATGDAGPVPGVAGAARPGAAIVTTPAAASNADELKERTPPTLGPEGARKHDVSSQRVRPPGLPRAGQQPVLQDHRHRQRLVADVVEEDGHPVLLVAHHHAGAPLLVPHLAVHRERLRRRHRLLGGPVDAVVAVAAGL